MPEIRINLAVKRSQPQPAGFTGVKTKVGAGRAGTGGRAAVREIRNGDAGQVKKASSSSREGRVRGFFGCVSPALSAGGPYSISSCFLLATP